MEDPRIIIGRVHVTTVVFSKQGNSAQRVTVRKQNVDSADGIIVIDSRYFVGRLGDRISDVLSNHCCLPGKYIRMAVDGVPHSGGNLEVLECHDLGVQNIVKNVRKLVS